MELPRPAQTQSLSTRERILYRGFLGLGGLGLEFKAGLTVPAGLVGAYSAGSAGLTRELAMGVFTAGCTERLVVGFAVEPVAGGFVFGLEGELVVGKVNAGLTDVPVVAGLAGACSLARAFAFTGLAGGAAAAFRVGLFVSSPRNFSSFLSLMAARIQVIQMGRAARAPVSFSPSD